MWIIIVALGVPSILFAILGYRLWMYGEDAQNAPQRELNADIDLHITRLDIERGARRQRPPTVDR